MIFLDQNSGKFLHSLMEENDLEVYVKCYATSNPFYFNKKCQNQGKLCNDSIIDIVAGLSFSVRQGNEMVGYFFPLVPM